MIRVYDSKGRMLAVGAEIGRGGEGIVYQLAADPNRALKIYQQPLRADKVAKLEGMVRSATPQLTSVSAWPLETLYDQPRGRLLGFVMPRLDSQYRQIHQLYGPAHRKLAFPKADWSFLIYAARNLAGVIDTIHHHGHVIGDINQSNILVSKGALIKFIDCDSFQVCINGRYYPCDVGVGHFTPPELQDIKSFHAIPRTTNHDNFGLAVLIFHLLFMGRHPFVGRYLGKGDMPPIERLIKEFRFAFGRGAIAAQMERPRDSLSLTAVSPRVAELFERAFSKTGASGGSRPTPDEWVMALDQLRSQLRNCRASPGHKFYSSLSECPWCQLVNSGGPDFFISVTVGVDIWVGFELQKAWATISAVGPLQPDELTGTPTNSIIVATPIPEHLVVFKTPIHIVAFVTIAGAFATIAGLSPFFPLVFVVLWVILVWATPYGRERRLRAHQRRATTAQIHAVTARWQSGHNDRRVRFQQMRAQVESAHTRYQDLRARYDQDRRKLESDKRDLQLRHYLANQFIDDARIPLIGDNRKAVLASYGIETAGDIEEYHLRAIRGFGDGLINPKAKINLRLGCTKLPGQRLFLSPLLILGEGEGEVSRPGLDTSFAFAHLPFANIRPKVIFALGLTLWWGGGAVLKLGFILIQRVRFRAKTL